MQCPPIVTVRLQSQVTRICRPNIWNPSSLDLLVSDVSLHFFSQIQKCVLPNVWHQMYKICCMCAVQMQSFHDGNILYCFVIIVTLITFIHLHFHIEIPFNSKTLWGSNGYVLKACIFVKEMQRSHHQRTQRYYCYIFAYQLKEMLEVKRPGATGSQFRNFPKNWDVKRRDVLVFLW